VSIRTNPKAATVEKFAHTIPLDTKEMEMTVTNTNTNTNENENENAHKMAQSASKNTAVVVPLSSKSSLPLNLPKNSPIKHIPLLSQYISTFGTEERKVTINFIAHGTRISHSTRSRTHYSALFCSNDHLILRSQSNNGVPFVRMISWFREQVKRIVTMDFSPSCEWLLCVSIDATIYLIPVKSFLSSASNPYVVGPVMSWPGLYGVIGNRDYIPSSNCISVMRPSPELARFRLQWYVQDGLLSDDSGNFDFSGVGSNNRTAKPIPSLEALVLETKLPNLMHRKHDRKHGSHDNSTSNTPLKRTPLGPCDDISSWKVNTKSTSAISHCLWWRTFDLEDYAVLASLAGTITFVNLKTRTKTYCKLKVLRFCLFYCFFVVIYVYACVFLCVCVCVHMMCVCVHIYIYMCVCVVDTYMLLFLILTVLIIYLSSTLDARVVCVFE